MPRVLQCTSWNDTAQTCDAQAWVEQPASFIEYLPTVDEAHTVGGVFFGGLITLAALASLLKPSRSTDE